MEQNQFLEPDENGEVPCPVCEEYHGKPESVEGHITGKSDEAHRGKIGKDYRYVQNGVRTLSTEQNPKLKGTIPTSIFDEETESDDTEPENVTQPEDEDGDGDRDRGVIATLILALVIAVLWLARRTGNEDELRKVELL